MPLFSHVFREALLKRFTPGEIVQNVSERLAKLGERFPPSLLAEMIYSARTGSAKQAVTLLVETRWRFFHKCFS